MEEEDDRILESSPMLSKLIFSYFLNIWNFNIEKESLVR